MGGGAWNAGFLWAYRGAQRGMMANGGSQIVLVLEYRAESVSFSIVFVGHLLGCDFGLSRAGNGVSEVYGVEGFRDCNCQARCIS